MGQGRRSKYIEGFNCHGISEEREFRVGVAEKDIRENMISEVGLQKAQRR